MVDNLPPALLTNLIKLVSPTIKRIAVVVDVRGREFFNDLNNSLAELTESGLNRQI